MPIKYEIRNRFSGDVQFVAEIDCDESTAISIKIGLAVKWGIRACANLSGANLSGANLSSANFYRANLSGADLSGAALPNNTTGVLALKRTRILPEGAIIGWKKCDADVIVKLLIPADAKRSHAFGRKCRAEYADCLEVIGAEVGISQHDGETEYRAGSRITPHDWSDDWRKECAGGIHFYITREEAEEH